MGYTKLVVHAHSKMPYDGNVMNCILLHGMGFFSVLYLGCVGCYSTASQ